MRILICSINFFPELTSTGKYTGEMATWLGHRGHEVRVVTAPPYYPSWRVFEGYSAHAYRAERSGPLRVLRCPLWVPRNPSGLKRVLHLASFAITSFPAMLWQAMTWKPQIVWIVEPPLLCAPAALLSAALSGAKSWLHVQDFEVDMAYDLGLLPPGRLRKIVASAERALLARFDRVSTISRSMLRRLEAKGVSEPRRAFFPNWVDTKAIRPLHGPSPLREELGVEPDAVVALYSGSMGEKQGLELLLEAAGHLEGEPGIRFVLCGEGSARARMETASHGLRNVRFLPLQPAGRLNELLNMADIHLLPQRAGAADLVMPSKLTGMLASGRPVIATAGPSTELGEVVAEAGGVVVPPGDGKRLSQAIATLAGAPSDRRRRGELARHWALRHLSQEAVLRDFEQHLLHLSGAARPEDENPLRESASGA